jgi:hypothetical protein
MHVGLANGEAGQAGAKVQKIRTENEIEKVVDGLYSSLLLNAWEFNNVDHTAAPLTRLPVGEGMTSH